MSDVLYCDILLLQPKRWVSKPLVELVTLQFQFTTPLDFNKLDEQMYLMSFVCCALVAFCVHFYLVFSSVTEMFVVKYYCDFGRIMKYLHYFLLVFVWQTGVCSSAIKRVGLHVGLWHLKECNVTHIHRVKYLFLYVILTLIGNLIHVYWHKY